MGTDEQKYSVKVVDDYVHLKTWGTPDIDALDAPANAAIALAKEHHLTKLLDDIRDIDSTDVSIPMQTKSMGILWKLRTFKKVAIILKGDRISTIFFSTLDVIHLDRESKFKGFTDSDTAIAWLKGAKDTAA
jgi:hypothetical protein